MAKLPHTSLTVIAITFLVMNLSTQLLRLFDDFWCLFFTNTSFLPSHIIETYSSLNCGQQELIS